MTRIAQFSFYFQEWRGREIAATENNYLKTALIIENHVNQVDSKQRIEEISTDPGVLASFAVFSHIIPPLSLFAKDESTSPFATIYGTILYGILSIEDHLKTQEIIPTEEKTLLDKISNNLKNLYTNLRQNPAEKIEQLKEACSQLLATERQHSEAEVRLTLSLYAMLTICCTAMSRFHELPWAAQGVINRIITIETIHQPLLELLEQIEHHIEDHPLLMPQLMIMPANLETPKITDDEAEKTDEEDEEDEEDDFRECLPIEEFYPQFTNLDEYFDWKASGILTYSSQSLTDQLTEIKTSHEQALDAIQGLMDLKNQKEIYLKELNTLQTDLIDQSVAEEANRRVPKRLSDGIQYIEAPFKSAFHSIAPQKLQQYVDSWVKKPPSPEMQRMNALHTAVANINLRINTTINQLADNKAQLNHMFTQASPLSLGQLVTKLQTTSELINTIKDFINTIQTNHETRIQAQTIDNLADVFIRQHDGFMVSLFLFLSRWISNYFKTTTAAQVEIVKGIQNELKIIKQNCQINIDTNTTAIRELEDISVPIKDGIIKEIENQPEVPLPPELTTDSSKDSKYNSIYVMFTPLKTRVNEQGIYTAPTPSPC